MSPVRSIHRIVGILLGLSSLLGGCLKEFQDPTLLDSLRVLAAQATPPEIRPDETFEVRTLVYSPRVENPQYRWAMCILEAPFTRPLGAGGGGGFSERPPSEQGDPPPSCLDREGVIEPIEVLDGGGARFAVPEFMQSFIDQLVRMELPDLDSVDLPEELRELLTLPDQFLLAVIHGINVTVSVEVSDGTETVLANKRVPIKLIPPPGPAATPVADDRPGPVRVEFGWETDKLHIEATFPGGRPAPGDGYVLRVYMPRHYWDPETQAPAALSSRATGPEGAPLLWFGQGAGHQLRIDLTRDPPAVAVFEASEAAPDGWRERSEADLVAAELRGTTLDVSFDPGRLAAPRHRPWAFLVALSQDGALVDTVPEQGWRYVHAGEPNENPAPPAGQADAAKRAFRPDGLRPANRQQYPVVTIRGEVVDNGESRAWSWFTDEGRWGSRRTRGDGVTFDDGTEHPDAEDRENRWFPGDPADPAEGPPTQWIVVRDGRGGAAWTDLTGVLPSGGQ